MQGVEELSDAVIAVWLSTKLDKDNKKAQKNDDRAHAEVYKGKGNRGWCLHWRQASIFDLCRRQVVCVTSCGPYFSSHSLTSS